MGGVVASAVARRDSAAPAAASGLASLSAENMHRASSFVVNTKRFEGFLPRSSDTEMTKSQLNRGDSKLLSPVTEIAHTRATPQT